MLKWPSSRPERRASLRQGYGRQAKIADGEVRFQACQWIDPDNPSEEAYKCGQPTVTGIGGVRMPYCEAHADKAYGNRWRG